MTPDQNDQSPASVQKYLKGVDYPATKEELRSAARQNGAPDEVLRLIDDIPGDHFDGPQEVMKAYGKVK